MAATAELFEVGPRGAGGSPETPRCRLRGHDGAGAGPGDGRGAGGGSCSGIVVPFEGSSDMPPLEAEAAGGEGGAARLVGRTKGRRGTGVRARGSKRAPGAEHSTADSARRPSGGPREPLDMSRSRGRVGRGTSLF